MDLKSGYPFWAVKNGLLHDFPQLAADRRCDVAVIGAGITGAIIADELARHGHDVVVVEQRDVGWGSTAASTALLQYEIDTHLIDLAKQHGEPAAVQAYTACAAAIGELAALARDVRDVGFARQDSLYLASRARDVPAMIEEHTARVRHGLPSVWLSPEALRERFAVEAPGALLTDLAASVDPYRFALRLLTRLERRGAGVFDRTRIEKLARTPRGVVLHTDHGVALRAKHVVVAAGYQTQRWLRDRVARNRSSYACVTDPIDPALLGALQQTLVWESARPYLYVRSTPDHRLVMGGADDRVDVPARRDARVASKTAKIVEQVQARWPALPLTPAFAWAGTFAETADGLPYFGAHAQHGPRIQLAMAYGGNGITYSMLGAGLVRAAIERRSHPLAKLFGFGRKA